MHEVVAVIGSTADLSFVENLPLVDVVVNTSEHRKECLSHFRADMGF